METRLFTIDLDSYAIIKNYSGIKIKKDRMPAESQVVIKTPQNNQNHIIEIKSVHIDCDFKASNC